ncbi:MAG: hypothetical protein KIG65_01065 [Eubacteriales bacterium]|nr:hypothetical protein [Eubacteriales bacterium]
MTELSTVTYNDYDAKIAISCYADTFVFNKRDGNTRELVAMRFGGYAEHVKAMSDVVRKGVTVQANVDNHPIILKVMQKDFRRSITHDGMYAEGMVMALDDEIGAETEEGQRDNKKDEKHKMYIFCKEGDTDELFAEFDRKTSIPLIPDFKDYILSECQKRGMLTKLKVLSLSESFDAYQLELSDDEQDMEAVVNDGLKMGVISIPNSVQSKELLNIKSVSEYLNKYGIKIANRIRDSFNPLFDPETESICDRLKIINGHIKKNVGYSLYPAQLAVAESLKRRLDMAKVGLVVAECGSGKTKIGSVALAAHQNGRKTFNVILSPSHVTKKWVREIEESLPNTNAEVVYSIADIKRAYKDFQDGAESKYIVLSKERARDGYMHRPAVVYSRVRKGFICPWCGEVVTMQVKRDDAYYTINANQYFFKKRNTQNHFCTNPQCKKTLWTALNPYDMDLRHNKWVKIGGYGFVYRDFAARHLKKTNSEKVIAKINEIVDNPDQIFIAKGAYRRYSMSSFIAEHIKNVDGLIADELHLFKGDSGQGDAMETLIGCSKKVIGMTATLINGYSSGLFYLLYRIVPHFMKADNKDYETPQRFNDEYGVTETTYELEESEYNENSKSRKKLTQSRQRPGVSPLVYSRFLMDCAVFLSLNDMGKHLPEYEEIPIELNLRDDIAEEYKRIEKTYKSVMQTKGLESRRLMSKFLSLLTTYPDQPYDAEPIMFPDSDIAVVEPKSLSNFDELHEKDTATLDIVKRKVENGEKVLIYTSWVKIDTQDKLKKLLEDNGYRVAVLPQTVAPEKREQWVEKKIKDGLDVLITNPSLVETGLDLNSFTTLIYYNIGYNLFTFRQSSRRSWRINQTAPRIEVYILYYKDVMQARAIRLMASKLAAATLVEGNFTDEGLAALGDDADMTSQLAKELTMGIKNEVEDVAEMFKRMAIIKDNDEPEEDMSEYIISDEVQVKVTVSIADKIEKARLLARQARGIKDSGAVKQNIQFSFEGDQMTLFDVA